SIGRSSGQPTRTRRNPLRIGTGRTRSTAGRHRWRASRRCAWTTSHGWTATQGEVHAEAMLTLSRGCDIQSRAKRNPFAWWSRSRDHARMTAAATQAEEPASERVRLRRGAARGVYDRDTIFAVLDAGLVALVGVVTDD